MTKTRARAMAGLLLACAAFSSGRAEINWTSLEGAAPLERVRQTVEQFSSQGSRVAGYPGAEVAARTIQQTFGEVGLDEIAVQEYDVSVPVDKGGYLQLDNGDQIALRGLWPNLVRTSTLPESGLRAPIIDAKSGEYVDLNGKDVEGAIALLDFNTGDRWLNCAYLGAAAILFIQPDSTVYLEGEKKFLTMPLDVPRFWIDKREGERLRRDLAGGDALEAQLYFRMDWERRPAWNIVGTIPGYDTLLKEDVIVLEAYYDAMSVVPALAPGAEQASSIVALLELARYFRQNPPARTVVFLATSAHHLGLRGVDDFIQRYLRKEEPFIERMLVRRVVDAALAQGMIDQEGVRLQPGAGKLSG